MNNIKSAIEAAAPKASHIQLCNNELCYIWEQLIGINDEKIWTYLEIE